MFRTGSRSHALAVAAIVLLLSQAVALADLGGLTVSYSQPPGDITIGGSELSNDARSYVLADDFMATGQPPVRAVRWWGAYEFDDEIRPDQNLAFDIAFYLSTGSHPGSLPVGSPVALYSLTATQHYTGAHNTWNEAVYVYEALLPAPFDQHTWSLQSSNPGELFISLDHPNASDVWCWQIVSKSDWLLPIGDWTAKSDSHNGPWATLGYSHGPWYNMDMAFEVLVPEPATVSLLAFGLAAFIARRGRSTRPKAASSMKGAMPVTWTAVVIMTLLPTVAVADVFDMPEGQTSLQFVTVSNSGNVGELAGGPVAPRICGAVAYTFKVGKFEITAAQYTQFLNAVAKMDTYGLYNTYMQYDGSSSESPAYYGCNVKRSGESGNYGYGVAPEWADRPVNFVSWGSAARFCNWLTNGQPTGAQGLTTTEDGSYFLNGATDNEALMAVTRRPGACYVIPTEDEWYKAAYHKNDGATGHYWDFPTAADDIPNNVLAHPDVGNSANFWQRPQTFTLGGPYWRTEVGDFENSPSAYSTFDQGGNVWEWNEAVFRQIEHEPIAYGRGLMGGSAWRDYVDLGTNGRSCGSPMSEMMLIGFRIAEVPEPATVGLLAMGLSALVARRRTRRHTS